MIILWAWLSAASLMCLVWLYYRVTNNPSVVDVAWSLGHWLAGSIFLFASGINQRSLLLWIFLTIWALRLAAYLYWTRIRVGIVDKRYTQLSQQWRMAPSLGFFLNFQMQAVLIILVVCSLYINGQSHDSSIGLLQLFGLLIVGLAIALETIADLQLRRFVQSHKGQVCNVGLWQYCRHPNYYFEWLVWVGFAITALPLSYGFIGMLSPLTLYIIMTQITGPMTEQGSLASKGQAYSDYQASVPMFFPRPWKK